MAQVIRSTLHRRGHWLFSFLAAPASIGSSKTAQTRWPFCVAVATVSSKKLRSLVQVLHCLDVQNHLSARAGITLPMALQVLGCSAPLPGKAKPWSCHVEAFCTSQSLTVHWDTKRPSQATLFRLRRKRSLKCMSALSGTVQRGVDRFQAGSLDM